MTRPLSPREAAELARVTAVLDAASGRFGAMSDAELGGYSRSLAAGRSAGAAPGDKAQRRAELMAMVDAGMSNAAIGGVLGISADAAAGRVRLARAVLGIAPPPPGRRRGAPGPRRAGP